MVKCDTGIETVIDGNASEMEKTKALNREAGQVYRKVHILLSFLSSARAPSSLTDS